MTFPGWLDQNGDVSDRPPDPSCPTLNCDGRADWVAVIQSPDGRERRVRACYRCLYLHAGRACSSLMTADQLAAL